MHAIISHFCIFYYNDNLEGNVLKCLENIVTMQMLNGPKNKLHFLLISIGWIFMFFTDFIKFTHLLMQLFLQLDNIYSFLSFSHHLFIIRHIR